MGIIKDFVNSFKNNFLIIKNGMIAKREMEKINKDNEKNKEEEIKNYIG